MRSKRHIDDLLAETASEWLEVLCTANESERAAFIDWLSESRLHVQEFLEIVAIDRELDRLDPERQENVEQLLQRIVPGVVPLTQRDTAGGTGLAGALRFSRWKLPAAIAACTAILGMSIFFFARHFYGAQEFTTLIGEQRMIELPDASVVHLNADSAIEVRLDERERDILLVHGEALFKVAHDAHRPFRVHTRAATLQAVGTQFNVYDRPEGTRVAVLEGRVRIAPERSGSDQILGIGEEALIRLDGTVERDQKVDVARSVAWRQRQLIFDNAALEDMVREFNRYNRSVHMKLEGVAPGSHHYAGIFDADDPDSLAQLLTREKDLVVERHDKEIIIRAR